MSVWVLAQACLKFSRPFTNKKLLFICMLFLTYETIRFCCLGGDSVSLIGHDFRRGHECCSVKLICSWGHTVYWNYLRFGALTLLKADLTTYICIKNLPPLSACSHNPPLPELPKFKSFPWLQLWLLLPKLELYPPLYW